MAMQVTSIKESSMKFRGNSEPETQFRIAPFAPEAVAQANEEFTRLAGEYADAKSNLAELKEFYRVAIHQANLDAVSARVNKTAPPKKTAPMLEAESEKKLSAAQAEVQVLSQAVDKAGTALAMSVLEHKAEWLQSVAESEEQLTDELAAMLTSLRAKLSQLGTVRGASKWLHGVNRRDIQWAEQSGFPGGSILVDVKKHFSIDSFTPVEKIVAMLDLAVDPPEAPKPRKVVAARKEDGLNREQMRKEGWW